MYSLFYCSHGRVRLYSLIEVFSRQGWTVPTFWRVPKVGLDYSLFEVFSRQGWTVCTHFLRCSQGRVGLYSLFEVFSRQGWTVLTF